MLFVVQAAISVVGMVFSILGLIDVWQRSLRLAASGRNGGTWVLVTHDAIAEIGRVILHGYIAGIAVLILLSRGIQPVRAIAWITLLPTVIILGLSFNSWTMRRRFDQHVTPHPRPEMRPEYDTSGGSDN